MLKIDYIRDTTNVNGSALTTTTSNVYIDDLPNDPTISLQTETAIVTDVVWTMGIPSVKKYKIDCSRTYSNINSQYQFIRGDRKLSSISDVTQTSNSSSGTNFITGTIYLDNNSINMNGEYVYDITQFSISNNNSLEDLHYTGTRNNTDTILTVNETIYSLKSSGVSKNVEVSVNHHFDNSEPTEAL